MDTGQVIGRSGDDEMHARRVTMPDGRYLIYYTFGDEPGPQAPEEPRPEPQVTPEITGDRRV